MFNKYAHEHLPPAVAKKGLYIERIGEGEVPLPAKSAGSKKAKNTAAAKTAVKKTKKAKKTKGGNGGDNTLVEREITRRRASSTRIGRKERSGVSRRGPGNWRVHTAERLKIR